MKPLLILLALATCTTTDCAPEWCDRGQFESNEPEGEANVD